MPAGSGTVAVERDPRSSNLLGARPYTRHGHGHDRCGVTFAASVCAANTITVTMTAAKGSPAGSTQGILRVWSGGTEVAHAAVYALIK